MTPALWFALSMMLLLLSHVLRAARLATLYPEKYAVRRFDLLLGLAMSYAINTVIPWRVGEIFRVLYVSRRCRIRPAFVAATVVAERLADVIVVGVLALTLLGGAVLPRTQMRNAAIGMFFIAALGLILGYGTKRSARFRRMVWGVASLFRNNIRDGLLDACWSFSEIVTGGFIGRRRFLKFTPIMWAGYTLSYYAFAKSASLGLREVAFAMVGSPLRSVAASAINIVALKAEARILIFTLAPVLVIILYGILRERTSIFRVLNSLIAGKFVSSIAYSTPVSGRFHQPAEYEAFLVSIFSQSSHILTDFSMTAIADGAVQRLFPGGSDAVTALVEVGDTLLIRKFAIGSAGEKLRVQADWLLRFRSDLPLVDVTVREQKDHAFFSYDMPYIPSARDFYEVIHTSPLDDGRNVLGKVIDDMLRFHQQTQMFTANANIVQQYISEKAVRNANISLEFSKQWFVDPGSRYFLNDREFDLADWNYLQDPAWLAQQITQFRISEIHGDLTIENIIVSKDRPGGFYLIDPNPGNIFNSPLIDWAKLMQSLHLGYEGLNRSPTCTWTGNGFSLILAHSHAYNELHGFCKQRLHAALGPEAQREISFHEIINYLRLTPYKIRNSPAKGLAFFACISLLLRDYLEEYC